MTVDQYDIRFFELRQYSCYDNDDLLLAHHFIRGLKDSLIGEVCMHQPRTLVLAVEKAQIEEENLARGFSSRSGSQNQSARNSGQDAQFFQFFGKGQAQSEPSQGGYHCKNKKRFWTKGGQDYGTLGKK